MAAFFTFSTSAASLQASRSATPVDTSTSARPDSGPPNSCANSAAILPSCLSLGSVPTVMDAAVSSGEAAALMASIIACICAAPSSCFGLAVRDSFTPHSAWQRSTSGCSMSTGGQGGWGEGRHEH